MHKYRIHATVSGAYVVLLVCYTIIVRDCKTNEFDLLEYLITVDVKLLLLSGI